MKPLEFFALAVVLAIFDLSSPSVWYAAPAHVLALAGTWASYRQFVKDKGLA